MQVRSVANPARGRGRPRTQRLPATFYNILPSTCYGLQKSAQQAAVHRDIGPRDVAGGVGAEESHQVAHIGGFADASERNTGRRGAYQIVDRDAFALGPLARE